MKKRKFYKDLNLDFKSFREDDDVTMRVFNNNIKRSVYTHNDRNNDVCVRCKKKDYCNSYGDLSARHVSGQKALVLSRYKLYLTIVFI